MSSVIKNNRYLKMAKERTLKTVFRKKNEIIDIILDGEIDIKKDVGDCSHYDTDDVSDLEFIGEQMVQIRSNVIYEKLSQTQITKSETEEEVIVEEQPILVKDDQPLSIIEMHLVLVTTQPRW